MKINKQFLLWAVVAVLLAGCGSGGSSTNTTLPANTLPVAVAGVDQSVTSGAPVLLNGNSSFDADGDPLTYQWTFVSVPPGSAATFSDAAAVNPSFSTDLDGQYVISLVVNDGSADSSASMLTITATTAVARPDSGQTTCYDVTGNVIACSGTGQDGAYTSHPMSFTDVGNGTIIDNVTGLMWQKQDDDTPRLYTDAQTYCSGLALGGYTDWRMPSIKELIDIFDYGRYGIPIDTTYFPNNVQPSSIYLSGSVEKSNIGVVTVWGVYAVSGGDANFSDTVAGLARCVRGGAYSPQSFADNGDGTVKDFATGLFWQQADDGVLRTMQDAITYCEGLGLAGYNDWRLPNLKELRSLVMDSRWNPAIDTTYFPSTQSAFYWTSTTVTTTPSYGWELQFRDGANSPYGLKTQTQYVRCVR